MFSLDGFDDFDPFADFDEDESVIIVIGGSRRNMRNRRICRCRCRCRRF